MTFSVRDVFEGREGLSRPVDGLGSEGVVDDSVDRDDGMAPSSEPVAVEGEPERGPVGMASLAAAAVAEPAEADELDEGELVADPDSPDGSADASPGAATTAAPIPRATASPPTRPTLDATPMGHEASVAPRCPRADRANQSRSPGRR